MFYKTNHKERYVSENKPRYSSLFKRYTTRMVSIIYSKERGEKRESKSKAFNQWREPIFLLKNLFLIFNIMLFESLNDINTRFKVCWFACHIRIPGLFFFFFYQCFIVLFMKYEQCK